MTASRGARNGNGTGRHGGNARRRSFSKIMVKIVVPLLAATIGAIAILGAALINRNHSGASSNQQQNSPGRTGISVSPSAPGSSFPTAGVPTSTSGPSLQPSTPLVCNVTIDSGQGITLGGDCPQNQLIGSGDLQYVASQISPGPGGRLVGSHPLAGGPNSYFHSCLTGTISLHTFNTGTYRPPDSFCYFGHQLIVFARSIRANSHHVELYLYIWHSS